MKILVFDATPLIYLGKTKILEKLANLPIKCVIPKLVYHEVIEIYQTEPEILYIQELISKGLFEIQDYPLPDKNTKYISQPADLQVIALAKKLEGVAVIDDQGGRFIANVEHCEVHGSIHVLFLLLRHSLLTKAEVKNIIDKMIAYGWYCSTELYTYVLKQIE